MRASVVIAAVVYVVVIIVWRIREGYVMRRFVHTVTHADANVLQCPQEPPAQAVREQVSVTSWLANSAVCDSVSAETPC
jgi:hypothetical protein